MLEQNPQYKQKSDYLPNKKHKLCMYCISINLQFNFLFLDQ